ncbi:glutathione S-transferase family protein [Plastoroseomonas hellenica]|uniref:glutathione S-transferase family protein n=1 Tax=Plastoroseomonas hellenica TaxID=2687306 RepID=UPI001BA6CB2D|nr:glutathione S-transferase family protein [Plastoroseomonas hellenica]MBR0641690.1 glutathione S-transferase family protein [Plastoroseomonas hellenica]
MTRIEIIGIPISNYVRVIRMACEEKGIAYALTPALPQTPEVLAIHPFGKIPVLRHGDVELCESKAIATYLDKVFPGNPLLPAEPLPAARVEQWVSMTNTVIDRTMIREYVLSYVFPKGAGGEPDRRIIDAALPALQRQVAVLDQAVAATGYLVGGRFTFADINVMPILAGIQRYPEGRQAMADARALTAYFQRHAQRPSFLATVPPA